MKPQLKHRFVAGAAILAGAAVVGISLHAAAPFTPTAKPNYIGGVALSTTNLMPSETDADGGGKLYMPWYENGTNAGDLIQLDVDADGNTTPTVVEFDPVSKQPTNLGAGNWSARMVMEQVAPYDPDSTDAALHSPTWWDDTRKIITRSNGSQVAFRWPNLTDDQKSALDPDTLLTDSHSEILDYVRGQRDYEAANPIDQALGSAALQFRDRWSILGDIMHSTPVYVGAPKENHTFDDYNTWKQSMASRAPRVYVGANDGMLHVFDAATGAEVYAYVPSMVIGNLDMLTVGNGQSGHDYFVDGPITVTDAQIGGEWRTVLIGTLGAGGKGIFALDITNPDLTSETSNTGDDAKILWELDASNDDDLGYSYSKPSVVRLSDGKWYVVTGNGYNSVNGKAMLYVIDLADGSVDYKIATDGSGSGAAPNGLSSPALVDSDDEDGWADIAYAGDIDGKLWKFDLENFTVAYGGVPLIDVGTSKPITTRPDVGAKNGGYMVYFGTGRLLSNDDFNSNAVQSIYGIWDKGTAPGTHNLLTQTIDKEMTYATDVPVRIMSNNTPDWNTHTGWKVDLPAGERLVTDLALRAQRVQMITTNPYNKDPQENWMMQLNYLNGGPPATTALDLNGDGTLTKDDNIDSDGNGSLEDATDVAAGKKLAPGIASGITFAIVDVIENEGTFDTTFYNNLNLPPLEDCAEECLGGFYGGHVDVDTDSPFGPEAPNNTSPTGTASGKSYTQKDGLGNATDGHQHEYDKTHGVVHIDMLGPSTLDNTPADSAADSRSGKLEPRRYLTSLDAAVDDGTPAARENNSMEEVDHGSAGGGPIPGNKQFIVVLANADLSTGGTLHIGDRSWDVVTYQNMVTTKLKELGKIGVAGASVDSSTFVDAEGKSLVFTLDEIKASGGTLRISFSNKAIIEGGLIPTSPWCVWGQRNPYTGASISISDAALNMHITKVPSGVSKDPSATDGFRWRNGALTLQALDASNFTIQTETVSDGTATVKALPVDKDGNLVGGVHAQKYSAVSYTTTVIKKGKKTTVTSSTPTGFTVSEGPNESGLLYENVTFWHFGDLYERRTGKGEPCFGNSNWQAAVTIEQGGLTLGEYNDILNGLTDDSAEIIAYTQALIDLNKCLKDSSCTEATLKTLQMNLHDAIAPIAEYVKFRGYAPGHVPEQHLLNIDKQLGSASGTGTGGASDTNIGSQEKITGGIADGPNYRAGRRTWTDISPE